MPRYQLRISGHVDATARLPRRQASGLDIGHPQRRRCRPLLN